MGEAESNTCEQWIYLLGIEKHVILPEGIQQVHSVASEYEVQLVPNEAYLDGDWNTRTYSVYENSDLIKSDQSPLLGECAVLLLFLCYDIYDAVGVSGWLVRH